MRPLPEPDPDRALPLAPDGTPYDFIIIDDPQQAPTPAEAIMFSCGHTQAEHNESFRVAADLALAFIADCMGPDFQSRDDTVEELARAEALGLNPRSMLAQLAYRFTDYGPGAWKGAAQALIGTGWHAMASVFALIGGGYTQTETGRSILDGLMEQAEPEEIMSLVRVACSGADKRGMTPDQVRNLKTVWHGQS